MAVDGPASFREDCRKREAAIEVHFVIVSACAFLVFPFALLPILKLRLVAELNLLRDLNYASSL